MTNEALAVMSVSSVTPTVLSQGSGGVVTISGSDFETDATVSFSSPGVKVTSSTLVSSSEISADIAVSKTARLGASSVTVTNPSGMSVTGTYAFTVAPLITSAPAPIQIGFAHEATRLSVAQERAIRAFVRVLPPGSSFECTGYGADALLANQRALRVARYVESLHSNAHVERRDVVSVTQSKAVLSVR